MIEDAVPGFTPLSDVGEFGLIARLVQGFPADRPEVLRSVGDDCAVLAGAPDGDVWLVTTDALAEGVHFDRMYTPLAHLGYKAAAVNLSDIYAMNGRPVAILVSLAISDRYSVEAIDEFYRGLRFACKDFHVALIGGDITSSRGGLFISITAIGRAGQEEVVYRSGASDKELLCVSGDLGAAYAGLQVLEREKLVYQSNQELQPDLAGYDYVLERQLRPQPRKVVIDALRASGIQPTSMIDVSDGLASELHHLAAAGNVGFQVYQDKLPIDPQTTLVADELNLPATTCALYGGEDYELLFTVRQSDFIKLKELSGIAVIGHVTPAGTGVQLVLADGSVTDIPMQGFDHFKSRTTAE